MVKNLPAKQETCVQSLGWEDPLKKGIWHGEFHGQRSLADYSPWGLKELGTTEWLTYTQCFFQTLISLEISTPKAFIHNSSSKESHPGIPYQISPPSAFHFLLLCLIFHSHFLPATNIIYLSWLISFSSTRIHIQSMMAEIFACVAHNYIFFT